MLVGVFGGLRPRTAFWRVVQWAGGSRVRCARVGVVYHRLEKAPIERCSVDVYAVHWPTHRRTGVYWTSDATVFRRGIVRSPALLLAIGIIGIVVELAGIAFCFPSLRLTYAITIDVFLIGIALLLGYTEPEWVVIILALALL